MSGLLNFIRGGVDREAVDREDKIKRKAERAKCDAIKAAELAERQAPAKEMESVIAGEADAADTASHDDYKAAVAYIAAKKSDSDKPAIIRKGAAWMRKAKISPQGFCFDVRSWSNKLCYDRVLANYESDLKALVKKRDTTKARLTKAEAELKAAKTEFAAADSAATELENTKNAYEIFRRKHIRLFGTPSQILDTETLRHAYFINGFMV